VTTAALWRDALAALEVRHPNGRSRVVLDVFDGDPPVLYVGLDETTCTLTGKVMPDFAISNVRLACWPGVRLAQQWFAAAWAGYLMHESLELVTLAGDRTAKVLDPHAEPYAANPLNRCLREGFPSELTPEALQATLCLVMEPHHAAQLMEDSLR
jgi:hypothetical protein